MKQGEIYNNTSNSTSVVGDDGLKHWNSPMPYLFGGLALMLGLISIALILLACSYRRSSSSSPSSSSSSGNSTRGADCNGEVEMEKKIMEPKFVVVMPGDINPTFIANPAWDCRCTCEQV